MCGRYTLTDLEKFLQRQAWIRRGAATMLPARFNVAPQQDVPAVVRDRESPGSGKLKQFRWGLVPSWAEDETVGYRMINARCEGVLEKPAFRRAMEKRRCLVPADAFYEWKKPARKGAPKQPYAIRLRSEEPFAFAGLWEVWHDPRHADRPPLFTCTIITCKPNELVAPLHDRMPVILPEARYHEWLETEETKPPAAAAMLGPYPASQMVVYPVDRRVGNVANDDPTLLEPVEPDDGPAGKQDEPTLF